MFIINDTVEVTNFSTKFRLLQPPTLKTEGGDNFFVEKILFFWGVW